MFDRLVQLFLDFIDLFRFFYVVKVYEQAVMLRFGKHVRTSLDPGIYWKWPFGVDEEIKDTVVPTAKDMPFQVLTLSDGAAVAVSTVVTYRTRDIEKLLLAADDAEAAILDVARGTILDVLQSMTWDEIRDPGVTDILTRAVREKGWKWGIEVIKVSLSDLQRARVLRVVTGE